jgi:hypothetical protein
MSYGRGRLGKLGLLATVLLTGATFYFMLTYSGPFKWLAELQLSWFGSYYEQLTFIGTIIVIGIPLLIVGVVWEKFGPKRSAPAGGADAASADRPGEPVGFGGVLPWMGIIVTGIGLFIWIRAGTMGPLTQPELGKLESGEKAASSYVEIRGVPMWEETITFSKGSGKTDQDHYVPLISETWEPGKPVAAYIEFSDSAIKTQNRADPTTRPFRGTTTMTGLPGPVRVEFEKSVLRPAAKYVVIEYGHKPETMLGLGKWMTLIGAGVAIVGLGWVAIKRSRSA